MFVYHLGVICYLIFISRGVIYQELSHIKVINDSLKINVGSMKQMR